MKPTHIFKDHTGQWRPVNQYPECFWDRDENGFAVKENNPEWLKFEQSITYHPFPDAPEKKQGEIVVARLQWQYYTENGWYNCDQEPHDDFKRQIWVAVTDSTEEELPNIEWDSNTLNPDNYDENGSPIVASAPKVEASAEQAIRYAIGIMYPHFLDKQNDIQNYYDEYYKYNKLVPIAMEQYATLKASSIQQENDRLKAALEYISCGDITIQHATKIATNALNKKSIMKKEDLINALKVMRHILFTAKLAYEPADKMIEYLGKTPLYTENDIQEAFLGGYLANSERSAKEIMETNYQHLYNSFRASCFLDRFGNDSLTPSTNE